MTSPLSSILNVWLESFLMEANNDCALGGTSGGAGSGGGSSFSFPASKLQS